MFLTLEEQAIKSLYGPWWEKYIMVDEDFEKVWFDEAYQVTVEPHTYGAMVFGNYVEYGVGLEEYADSANINIKFIGDELKLENAWWAIVNSQFIGDNVEVEDSDFGIFELGTVVDTFYADDSHFGQVDAGYIMDGFSFNESSDWQIDTVYTDSSDFNESNNVDVETIIADGHWDIDESDEFVFKTIDGPDAMTINESEDFDIESVFGDTTYGINESSGTLVAGSGDDHMYSTDSVLAYNLGEGKDTAFIDGGKTVGVATDGEADTFIFTPKGKHDVFVDRKDSVFVELEASGLWSAEQLDAIDNDPGDGMVSLGDEFELTVHESFFVEEWAMVA